MAARSSLFSLSTFSVAIRSSVLPPHRHRHTANACPPADDVPVPLWHCPILLQSMPTPKSKAWHHIGICTPLLHHATLVSQGAEWPGQGGELADQIHAWCMHFCFALSFGESSKEKDTLSLFCDEEKGEGAHQGPGL